MSNQDDASTIEEYLAWQAKKKQERYDDSPAQFIIERAREQSIERLIEVVDYVDSMRAQYSQEDPEWPILTRVKRLAEGG